MWATDRKRQFSPSTPDLVPPSGVIPSEFRKDLLLRKTRVPGLSCVVAFEIPRLNVFGLTPTCDRQTDEQTDGQTDTRWQQITRYHNVARVKTDPLLKPSPETSFFERSLPLSVNKGLHPLTVLRTLSQIPLFAPPPHCPKRQCGWVYWPMVVITVVEKNSAPENFHCVPKRYGMNLMMLAAICWYSVSFMWYLRRSLSFSALSRRLAVTSCCDSSASNTAAPTSK